MGIFDKIFKSERDIAKEEIKKVDWIELTSPEQLEKIKSDSVNKAIVILKHSTRCGISRMVLRNFENEYDLEKEAIDLYFLDLIQHREISNKIAEDFKVRHESPQVLVIKDGEAVYHNSHQGISARKLADFV